MRLFVAVYPPPGDAMGMLALLEGMDLPKHRVTPVEQVHMTLQFIGDRHERELDEVIESVERSAAGIGAFQLTPRAIVSLPERGSARLLAVETDAPAGLMEIQRRLAHRLADPTRRSRGSFLPHMTACRFADETRMPRLNRPVELGAFEVNEIRLIKSVLRPGGALHAPVHGVRLDAGAGR
jgi:RNA 2',3'-cyclic 3'-phosphodiesterase